MSSNKERLIFKSKVYFDGDAIEYKSSFNRSTNNRWFSGTVKYETGTPPEVPYWRIVTDEDGRGLSMSYITQLRNLNNETTR